jgi:Adenylylsulphate kinase
MMTDLREGLRSGLELSRKDRGEQARRVAEVTALLSQSVALVALVSHYQAGREDQRGERNGRAAAASISAEVDDREAGSQIRLLLVARPARPAAGCQSVHVRQCSLHQLMERSCVGTRGRALEIAREFLDRSRTRPHCGRRDNQQSPGHP